MTQFRSSLRRCLAGLLCSVSLVAAAQAPLSPPATPLGPLLAPLWLRYPAISPDGQQIAFAFQGNLFVVPAAGGAARLLVGNGHHSFMPVWSPDGRRIAYASDVHGNFDVFLVDALGGPSRRLTTHSASELPSGFTADGQAVLFSAQRMDARSNLMFPARPVGELYSVSVDGGKRPHQVLTTPALAARFDASGTRLLYEDWKGYESEWRKHHLSPVARDIWLVEPGSGRHQRLTDYGGEDRNPVWSPDAKMVYFLSERSGSFNVWKMPLDRPAAAEQVTRFTKNPVRFLSMAGNGTLSFGYDGELYTLAAGAVEPAKVAVQIQADTRGGATQNLQLNGGVTEIATSPDGQEVAYVVRGEIFVMSTEFGDTRRITDTAAQERSVSFSPDGRRLVFASERDGSWNLYEASLAGTRTSQPHFYSAPQVKLRTLLQNGKDNFQPRWSPDGKEVAYLEARTTLKVLNLASGQTRVVLAGDRNYSYEDGDQWFDWSPDGGSLLSGMLDRQRWSNEVALVDAKGERAPQNLTQNGYEDDHPVWAQGGQMVLWSSDRQGLHGTSGEGERDAFGMFLTQQAFDRFKLDKAEFAQLKKQEDDDKAKQDKKAQDKKTADDKAKPADGDDDPAAPLPAPVVIETQGLDQRIVRLTPNSGRLRAAAMTPDGETLLYVMQTAEGYDLWMNHPREDELKKVGSVPAGKAASGRDDAVDLQLDAKGENGFLLAQGAIQKFKLPKGEGAFKLEPMKVGAEMRLDPAGERASMFEHVWRQTLNKLYAKDMNGVDWAYYRQVYTRFLPYVSDNHDFAELLSEMLGELNVSHTGSGYRPRLPGSAATAALGLFFDDGYRGAGLKVAEVIAGGPLAAATSKLRAGMVVEAIDGTAIAPDAEFDSLLDQKAGQRLLLSVRDPASGALFDQVVKPITLAEQNELLYTRWVEAERQQVEALSGGRLGYVHVRGMDDESYRHVYGEVLGRYSARQALIVDTRFNGGGNLHDELATLLSGRRYLEFVPRGQPLGWEPVGRWTRPSIVLMSESNYSDAHLFPWVYRHLGIGKLLGMPVAGTGTAVWWERLQDRSLYFGIPQVGFRDAKGEYMETALLVPDIQVANDPALIATGRDQQLEAAVQELLKQR